MSMIRKFFRVEGVLTDPTSMKLSNKAATFGVKRDDTQAVVVADDTAMTQESTGVYSHTFTDSASDLTYTYSVEIVYGGETTWIEDSLIGPATPLDPAVMSYSDLLGRVAWFLGFGIDTAVLTAKQTAECDRIVQDGYNRFLNPPLTPNGQAHEWSFLSPVAELVVSNGTLDYDMPVDFGSIVGSMTYDEAGAYPPVHVTGEGRIRAFRARQSLAGPPRFVAFRPKPLTSAGQLTEVLIWPDPNGTYTLLYRYNVTEIPLSAAMPYPLGGALHSRTLLASCLAYAELSTDEERGVQHADWLERVAASIRRDQETQMPDFFGYNGDLSDELWSPYRTDHVTVKGAFPV